MNHRLTLAVLSLSAAGLIGIAVSEGYTDSAIQPLPGDKPTMGFGSTTHADGTPVRLGERTDPVRALQRVAADVQERESAIKSCITAPLYQHEYDAYVDHAYNVGTEAFCRSTMAALINQGRYAEACAQFDRWVFFQGKDCRVRENRCYGLVERRARQRAACEGAQ